VLVLGPGLARGYAYVGALRALEEAKIPIAAVLGTEMGAFVGSLYAMDGKINQLEWAMLKFRDGTFDSQGSLLPEVFKRKARAKKLEEGLLGVFDSRDLSQSKLPIRIAVQTSRGEVSVVERGPALSAVRAAIADPEIFGPAEWNGGMAGPAARTRPLLVHEAKAMNLGPVVVIDAAGTQDVGDADLVIRPNLSGIGPRDFQKRTEAAFRGKSAVRQKIPELRHLVGLPAEADPTTKGNL
jgi:NTE family protein